MMGKQYDLNDWYSVIYLTVNLYTFTYGINFNKVI